MLFIRLATPTIPTRWIQYLPQGGALRPPEAMGYTCTVCGAYHDERAARHPHGACREPVFRLDERARDERAWVERGLAVLHGDDGERYFVRGAARAPAQWRGRRFGYGVWVGVDADEFAVLGESGTTRKGAAASRSRATLANELSPVRGDRGLPVGLRLRDVHVLPLVELTDGDAPARPRPARGISDHRAHELAEPYQQAVRPSSRARRGTARAAPTPTTSRGRAVPRAPRGAGGAGVTQEVIPEPQ